VFRLGYGVHWKLSLVSVPVKAYPVITSGGGDINLNQLHAHCHSRIRYQKVCPIHGQVNSDDIVSAYEYTKGRYIIVDADELDKLRTTAATSASKLAVAVKSAGAWAFAWPASSRSTLAAGPSVRSRCNSFQMVANPARRCRWTTRRRFHGQRPVGL
jgi:hypothetical protein